MISSISLIKKTIAVMTYVIIIGSKQRILRSIISHALVVGTNGKAILGDIMNRSRRARNVGKSTISGT